MLQVFLRQEWNGQNAFIKSAGPVQALPLTDLRDLLRMPVPELACRPFLVGSGSTPNLNASAAILCRCLITNECETLSRTAIWRTPKPSASQHRIWLSRGVSHLANK